MQVAASWGVLRNEQWRGGVRVAGGGSAGGTVAGQGQGHTATARVKLAENQNIGRVISPKFAPTSTNKYNSSLI